MANAENSEAVRLLKLSNETESVMGRLFGTDGVRGKANSELTCELAMSIGRATATVLQKRNGAKLNVLIGCDTRLSSDMISMAIASGLCSSGANARYLGTVTTPAVAYLTRKLNADAGIMISASHNPAKYNGIKIFSSNGFKLPDELEEQIETLINNGTRFPAPVGTEIGRIDLSATNEWEKYAKHLRESASEELSGLRIAIDCANGSASRIAPKLFSETGAIVRVLSADPNGTNINDDCGSTHLSQLTEFVRRNGLDAGFAFDGDADRCLCVDSDGNEVDGDMIMAMCALDMKQRGKLKNNTVVGTVMTNFGFSEFCRNNGIEFVSTKVGDRFVLEEMLVGDFMLGGEQSGHIIFREFATTGDGLLTALQVLSLMKRTESSLSELASAMTKYPQTVINIQVTPAEKLRFFTDADIKKAIDDAARRLGENGRLLVRPSGTEPLIRVMTEGHDKAIIKETAERVANTISSVLSAF